MRGMGRERDGERDEERDGERDVERDGKRDDEKDGERERESHVIPCTLISYIFFRPHTPPRLDVIYSAPHHYL